MRLRTLIFGISLTLLSLSLYAQSHHSTKSNGHVRNVAYEQQLNIVEIAVGSEIFSTLVTAVKTAGLVETLQGEGPFTVFAPTNAAFSKLPEGTVSNLLEPDSKATLTQILTYHVVSGEFFAKDVVNAIKSSGGAYKIETVSGDLLTATLNNGTVILTDESGNRIAVTDKDIDASNGVIHIIDSVLLPK